MCTLHETGVRRETGEQMIETLGLGLDLGMQPTSKSTFLERIILKKGTTTTKYNRGMWNWK